MESAFAPYFAQISVEEGALCETAVGELSLAAKELFGLEAVARENDLPGKDGPCLVLSPAGDIAPEGYRISAGRDKIVVEASDRAGFLYGAFALIRAARLKKNPEGFSEKAAPSNPLRMLDHWDNADGSIERGYSGKSFFFRNGELLVNERTEMYARLAASAGINAVVINNVNVGSDATQLITGRYAPQLKKLSALLERYCIRLFLSVNFAAPMEIGGLSTCDPLSEEVGAWWKERCDSIYEEMPGFGGFLVKADSEGRPGPFTYGRDHADGANMLAAALAPHGGTLIWRCFVYNCTQDWRDKKTDRARSAYDNFMPLDGRFADNVILQIKNGPMDFQVREPVLPLFGGLTGTRQMLEVQIAQEYTGQQIDLCYLIPWFRQILDFRTYCPKAAPADEAAEDGQEGAGAPAQAACGSQGYPKKLDSVADIISGRAFPGLSGGIAAVANTGDDANWTGHDLAAANLYGFGRLAYDTSLTAEQIADEWIGLTFDDAEASRTIHSLLMMSWPVYESYTSPLGIGWMVNPGIHYGPNVDGYEYDRWGTYHRSDCRGLGVDRTSAGTGYAGCYNPPVSGVYADPEKCPDELVLFFHHLPYTWRLKSGKTVIQHIYDSHFEGAGQAAGMRKAFEALEGRLPEKVYARTLERFRRQEKNAAEWRDRVNTYYHRMSGIEDEKGREIY